MNLTVFWAESMKWDRGIEQCRWALTQMAGLMSGLEAIHSLRTPEDPTCRGAIHGDLHPDNILLVKISDQDNFDRQNGMLQISDMGLFQFLQTDEQSEKSLTTPLTLVDTGTYEAPDQKLNLPASRAADIWSMGCIFLEFCFWLLEGPGGVQRFSQDRFQIDQLYGDRLRDDYFFSLRYEDGAPVGATVRDAVKVALARLPLHDDSSPALRAMIDIIGKSMLRPDPMQRSTSETLFAALKALADRGENNHAYVKPII